jgi:hypothetical protein
MMNPQEVSSRLLARGKQPANLQTLMDLFRQDRELFFTLAVVGVPLDAEPWAVKLARLAARLRGVVRRGYALVKDAKSGETQLQGGTDRLSLGDADEQEVAAFLRQLNGTAKGDTPGKDYAGAEISEAEAFFGLGDPESWEADRRRLEQRVGAKPLVLRLDETDRKAVTGGAPAYTVYGLRYSATKLVQTAAVLYRGLRRDGWLQQGFAFSGRLPKAFDNAGRPVSPPEGMVYVVYADPEGYVFDWDWVLEAPGKPGHPIDWKDRFPGRPETAVPEAVLVGVDDVSPAQFDSRKAWPSPRGDCIFCYFSDDFAFADRINNDLTVFRSVATNEPTGFKIKNVHKILEDGFAQVGAPDLEVGVQAFLLETFRRNPKSDIRVYSLLIEAWFRRATHADPPKIPLQGLKEACGAGR